jgi:hypothetical protein
MHLINSWGTPWTGDQPCCEAAIYTGQHKHRRNADIHPCFEWNLNPRSQCLSERRHFMSWLGHCDRHINCPASTFPPAINKRQDGGGMTNGEGHLVSALLIPCHSCLQEPTRQSKCEETEIRNYSAQFAPKDKRLPRRLCHNSKHIQHMQFLIWKKRNLNRLFRKCVKVC